MSHHVPAEEAESQPIKVNDKRRFRDDGAPREDAASREEAPAAEAAPPQSELASVTRELEAARKRVNELATAWQASERDREDFKQRLQRERDRLIDVERGNVALALLEAIDELDLCLMNADESPLAAGVRLIRDNLVRKAEASGIERVELAGQAYDPNLAEASDMELTDDRAQDGRITTVIKACYQLKGRVVRPGRVRVAKYVAPAQA